MLNDMALKRQLPLPVVFSAVYEPGTHKSFGIKQLLNSSASAISSTEVDLRTCLHLGYQHAFGTCAVAKQTSAQVTRTYLTHTHIHMCTVR